MGAYRHSTSSVDRREGTAPPTAFVDDHSSPAGSVVLMASFRTPAADRTDNAGGPPGARTAGLAHDLLVRLAGLLAIGCSAGALFWLHRLLHGAGQPRPTVGQYLLALTGFLGASLGSGLLALGRHVHDRVELSERWRPRS